MPTVHRAGDLRFVIFLDDHGPPHVHVFSAGGGAKLLLEGSDGRPALLWARGMDRRKLLLAWHRLHGSGSDGPEER